MSRIHPAIMCGGSGTRLWPLSRTARPKQLLALATERSLLHETIERALAIDGVDAGDVMLIATRSFSADLVRIEAQAAGAPEAELIVEPVGKNTAATAAIAALAALARDPDGLVLLLSADHHIPDRAAFSAAVNDAALLAAKDYFVVLGVKPTRPHTGYGYIARGAALAPGFEVAEFLEKPNREKAQELYEGGAHAWNAGIFLFRPRLYLDELKKFEPEVLAAAEAAFKSGAKNGALRQLDDASWSVCPSISIDKAVAERTQRAAIIPTGMNWADIGSWNSLWEIGEKDGDGNVLIGAVETFEVTDTYVRAGDRLVALLGVSDLVVVETADVVVIAPRGRSEDIKKLVEALIAKGRKDVL
jgi:mannose-1-phosphate guanylyltransferase/mannose-6-phosphate isomerase